MMKRIWVTRSNRICGAEFTLYGNWDQLLGRDGRPDDELDPEELDREPPLLCIPPLLDERLELPIDPLRELPVEDRPRCRPGWALEGRRWRLVVDLVDGDLLDRL